MYESLLLFQCFSRWGGVSLVYTQPEYPTLLEIVESLHQEEIRKAHCVPYMEGFHKQFVYIASWMNISVTIGKPQAVESLFSTDAYILQSPV